MADDEIVAKLVAENDRLRNALVNITKTPRRDGILACQRIATEALRGDSVTAVSQESLGDPVYFARVIAYLHDRYHSKCVYCGATDNLQIDHLIPVSRGGSDNVNNLCLACQPCNTRKGTQTVAEFGFKELELMTLGAVLPTWKQMRARAERDAAFAANMERVRGILGK